MKTTFQLFDHVPAIDAGMEYFAAVITTKRVIVARVRNLRDAEDRALALDTERNFIGIVLPRLCTKGSMQVEADRIFAALFGANALRSLTSIDARVALGGYAAVHATLAALADRARKAFVAHHEESTARESAGRSYLAVLASRGSYGERATRRAA